MRIIYPDWFLEFYGPEDCMYDDSDHEFDLDELDMDDCDDDETDDAEEVYYDEY